MTAPAPPSKLTVITTHTNADYDALASMFAAQKLYPDSVVVFPGSQEKNLRNFFIQSVAYLFNLADISDIDFQRVGRLVLVDTKQAHRIGALAGLLDMPEVEIHIYDHHPRMANDIKGHKEIQRATGANVTILTELIMAQGLHVSPDEATIMCLGIYEDTGSFTFASTTEADFNAAAFLLSKGANLNIIASLIDRELSPQQVSVLNDLIQALARYNIGGIEVAVTTVSLDDYIPEFALLIHKLIRMENLDALFAIAGMGKKVYLVARSRVPEVDVGTIVTQLGGGGHPYAAAATLRELTPVQAEQQLLDLLHKSIRSRRLAKDLMSAPPITVNAGATIKEASELINRYSINALLVKEGSEVKDGLSGYITRQVIEKALYHKLEDLAVSAYMSTEMVTVKPESDLGEIQDKIIENKQRILPVIENGTVIGVVTRTDLLNILVRRSKQGDETLNNLPQAPLHARSRYVVNFMRERLPKRIHGILKDIGQTAEHIGCKAYVVGGFVRDLFLFRPNEDLDIVIEGNGIAFARKYAAMVGARIHSHAKFGTAVIIFPDDFKIDVASARLEYYQFPAALPTVEMSSIKLDLFRRDFTINTLAIQLNPDRFGLLIDFFLAQRDLKDKVIRVLHNLSFVEDPTRVFRAIRFEQRFGFSIGKLTAGLIKNAVQMNFFKRLSGRRVFSELRQILEEENPVPAIVRLSDYDLLQVIHPAIALDKDLVKLLNAVKGVLSWLELLFLEESYMKWAVYLLALTRNIDKKSALEFSQRLELVPRYQKIFTKERFEADRCLYWLERRLPARNSTLYRRLAGFRAELILYMMAATRQDRVKRALSHYFTRLRSIQPALRGSDLKAMGIHPGPVYRKIFDTLLDAKLNGHLATQADEIKYVKRRASRWTNTGAKQ